MQTAPRFALQNGNGANITKMIKRHTNTEPSTSAVHLTASATVPHRQTVLIYINVRIKTGNVNCVTLGRVTAAIAIVENQ